MLEPILEPMFDQELVTRNEILRNRKEAAKEAAEKAAKETTERFVKGMLLEGFPDSKIMRYTGISKQELEALKQKLK